jgi:hypothetical protein
VKLVTDGVKGGLIVAAVFAVPALGIGIAVAVDNASTDDSSRPQPAASAPIPLPAPTTPPAPPPVAPEVCEWGDPPPCFGQIPGETERYRGLRPGGGGSWSPPRGPSSPRPIPPYPALPGDPNDRDHDGRACESGCIN